MVRIFAEKSNGGTCFEVANFAYCLCYCVLSSIVVALMLFSSMSTLSHSTLNLKFLPLIRNFMCHPPSPLFLEQMYLFLDKCIRFFFFHQCVAYMLCYMPVSNIIAATAEIEGLMSYNFWLQYLKLIFYVACTAEK